MTDAVKKLLSLMLAVSLAAIPFSCKSFDPKLLEQRASFNEGVMPMRVVVNTDSIKSCFPGGLRDKYHKGGSVPPVLLFAEQESLVNLIKQNLMFGKDSRNVYLSVLVRNVEWGRNSAWIFFGILGAGVFYLFGVPSRSDTVTIDMEAAIMNSSGKIIKTYKARGKDAEYIAIYWGYLPPEDTQTAYTRAMIAGCADLRKQIEADRENLNKLIR